MKTMIIPVGYSTDSFCTPTHIKISFTPEDIKKIKRVMKIVKKEGLESAKIRFEADYFNDENCTKENTEFRSDISNLIIFSHCVYFYAQHKHDNSNQFESAELTIKEIESGEFDKSKME